MNVLSPTQLAEIEADKYSNDEIIPSPQLQEQMAVPFHLTYAADLLPCYPRRYRFSNKGSYGHALLVAGKQGMAGASILAGRAAMRSGIGLLTIHAPLYNIPILQTSLPEAIIEGDLSEHCFASQPDNLSRYSAMAIGPGIGQDKDTANALFTLVKRFKAPLILDADALNILSSNPQQFSSIPFNSILTPHPKEFERLAGATPNATERLRGAISLATNAGLYIVLKGSFTVVVTPQGECHFNTTGNAGMATAGSGDVLTGILLALSAQGIAPLDVCRLGVYLHGLAGDLAAQEVGGISLMASDIVEKLPAAWMKLGEATQQNNQ